MDILPLVNGYFVFGILVNGYVNKLIGYCATGLIWGNFFLTKKIDSQFGPGAQLTTFY